MAVQKGLTSSHGVNHYRDQFAIEAISFMGALIGKLNAILAEIQEGQHVPNGSLEISISKNVLSGVLKGDIGYKPTKNEFFEEDFLTLERFDRILQMDIEDLNKCSDDHQRLEIITRTTKTINSILGSI